MHRIVYGAWDANTKAHAHSCRLVPRRPSGPRALPSSPRLLEHAPVRPVELALDLRARRASSLTAPLCSPRARWIWRSTRASSSCRRCASSIAGCAASRPASTTSSASSPFSSGSLVQPVRRPRGGHRLAQVPLAQVPGRAPQQLAGEVLVDVQACERPLALLRGGDAQRQERPLGVLAPGQAPARERAAAVGRSDRPPAGSCCGHPPPVAKPAASRRGSRAAPTGRRPSSSAPSASRSASSANTGRSSSIIRSRPSGLE